MANARFRDVPLAPQAGDGAAELVLELAQIVTAPVTQLDPFEVAPDPLVGIHVWRITGQGLEVETLGRARGQEGLDGLAAMDRRTIPDHQKLPRDVVQQVFEKTHDVASLESAGLDVEQQAALPGETADRREVVVGQGDGQEQGLAFGGIGPDPRRQEEEAGFVDPDDRPSFVPGFFSRVGQRSVSQASTWAGSRCAARTSGCWTL
jgi:hypothetical protein